MKKLIGCLLCLMLLLFGVQSAGATAYTLGNLSDPGDESYKGATTGEMDDSGAIATIFTDDMQTFQSSGSGVIDPFLTIQNDGYEEGFNTDGDLLYDQKRGANPNPMYADGFTHSITYSELVYGDETMDNFAFLLDSDEPSQTKGWINLIGFEIYLVGESYGGALETYAEVIAAGTQVFDLGADSVLFDSTIWAGSGHVLDLELLVPYFSGISTDYVYVFSTFGVDGETKDDGGTLGTSGDGYEEWILGKGQKVPEPSAMFLLGTGLLGLVAGRKKIIKN